MKWMENRRCSINACCSFPFFKLLQWLPNCGVCHRHVGGGWGGWKTWLAALSSPTFEFMRLICISTRFPGQANAVGLGTSV